MRRLILVRHAKTEPMAASDFERELTESGEQEAALMAARLIDKELARPDRLLTSPAARARATAAAFTDVCGLAQEQVLAVPELYLADPAILLDVIGRYGGEAATLMVVAHNPGISELLAALSGQAVGELPTAAVAQLAWPGNWNPLPPERLRLVDLDYPRAAFRY